MPVTWKQPTKKKELSIKNLFLLPKKKKVLFDYIPKMIILTTIPGFSTRFCNAKIAHVTKFRKLKKYFGFC